MAGVNNGGVCVSVCLHASPSSSASLSATKPLSSAESCSIWILLLPVVVYQRKEHAEIYKNNKFVLDFPKYR